jgi:hypothetical protein
VAPTCRPKESRWPAWSAPPSDPFARVVTSASPRAVETALAMGFAVDDAVELPSGYVPGEVEHHQQWRWPRPYSAYAELLGRGGGLPAVAEAYRVAWTGVVEAVPEGAAALVVCHGCGIEAGLVACLPDVDHGSSGAVSGRTDPITAALTVLGHLRRRRLARRCAPDPW